MTPDTAPALILVVEDEKDLRGDIIEELQDAGYRTLAAQDGRDALALLDGAAPDLVLCDITMPGLDGYGVLRAIRDQRPDLSTVPFVFLTALSEPYEVVQGKLQGADDYLVKPIDYDLMLATIAARLRQVGRIRSRYDRELATMRRSLSGLSSGGAEAALDLIALGIVLLDGHGKVLHINRAARQMGVDTDFRHAGQATLRWPDPLSDRELQVALSGTLKTAKAGGDKTAGVMLHLPQEAGSVQGLVCSLAPDLDTPPARPHLALFLSAPFERRQVCETVLMDLFGLTPTEARVAGALARSTRAADVAAELGVSQTTISFHMRNLFQKTGTHRQADLIALILAGPMMVQAD